MRIRLVIVVGVAALMLALPASAYAAAAKASKASKASKEASRAYDLDFTLPTAGKSGCQVCHGDPNLVRVGANTAVSLFVSSEDLQDSAHEDQVCTGCHMDFAFKTPHENVVDGSDWRATAKQACKNCKQHQPQFSDYASGAHSPAGRPGVAASVTVAARKAAGKPTAVPLCGDCHGGHRIASKDDTATQLAFHNSGIDVCGGCHVAEAASYGDYYHGAAYRQGAADAPSCWDCHGTHEILPADDPRSMVSEKNLSKTCGQEGCHAGEVDKAEFLQYAGLIHRRGEELQKNPVWSVYDSARQGIRGAFQTVASWF